jgi:aspartate aminotransferase/aminotransferase
MTPTHWISDRAKSLQVSGIRKVFDLGRSLKDPVNLSIGQPHFDVPAPIRAAARAAIDDRQNGYTVTQGIAPLRDRLIAEVKARLPHPDREVLVTSGTSGGLLLAMLAVVNPGDEVIAADPYFVAYPNLVAIAGGTLVTVDTHPDFRLDPDKVKAALTSRTKVILLCSPSNPTGAVIEPEALKAIAALARKHGILLVSDEIYRAFHFDGPPRSPAEFDESVLVIEGFGKTYGVTGWRLGFAHGPRAVVEEMTKLQQFTFVCAPAPFQHAAVAAMDFDVSDIVADYKHKRDLLVEGLRGRFEFARPGGAFYLYPKSPWGTGTEFVTAAIRENLLVIPGVTFSQRDTHFRISYAAADETLRRGIEILNRLAANRPL